MFRFTVSAVLVKIFFSLIFANAQAETSRNLPAEMGVALWLKADEKLELDTANDGTVVSRWESKVGNLIATQSSNESARIVGNQTAANNKQAIFFPQGNETGGYGHFEIPSNFNLKNSTVFVSLKYEGVSEAPRVLSFSADGGEKDGQSNNALALMFFRDSPNRFRLESNLSGPNDPQAASSPIYSSGNWAVLGYRINGSGDMTVSLAGVAGNQTSNPTMGDKNTAAKTRIGLGATTSRGQQNLANAYIYEVLIFNKYLDTGNYTNAQNYMQDSMDASSVEIDHFPIASPIDKGGRLFSSVLMGGNASSNGIVVAGDFSWTDNSSIVDQSGNYSVTFEPKLARYNFLKFEVPVIVNPELIVTPDSLTGFSSRNGTVSFSKSISISGTNLTSNITISISSETGFEISTDNSTFGLYATIPVVSGNASSFLYARLAGNQTSSGVKMTSLNVSSGSQNRAVTLEGTVFDASDSYIEIAPTVLEGFVTTSGTSSASANFTVNAFNLSGNLSANASTGFEIALGDGTYAQTLEIPLAGGNVTTSLNLRVAASASAGALSGSVLLTSGSASNSLSVTGTVNAQRTPPTQPAPTPEPNSSKSKNFNAGRPTPRKTVTYRVPESPKKTKSNAGKKVKKKKFKKKSKKKSREPLSQVVAVSGSTWITADRKVLSENERERASISK